MARVWWKDDDHGWRAWERFHFAYTSYLRIWLRWEDGEPGVRGLSEEERAILADRLGVPEAAFARANLEPPLPREGHRVWRVLFGREPDLFPWYRNPIHRAFADLETVEFEFVQ